MYNFHVKQLSFKRDRMVMFSKVDFLLFVFKVYTATLITNLSESGIKLLDVLYIYIFLLLILNTKGRVKSV